MPKVQARRGSVRKVSYASLKKDAGAKKSFPYPKPSEKNPKDSHLYTDDNPATTLSGTGFKDEAAAEQTIELVGKRSLLYQFQTINTMFNRAKHHPHHTDDIEKAMAVFEKWLKETYPAAKASQRDFKPVLSKKLVRGFMDKLKSTKEIDTDFVETYIDLEPRKRLANTLVDPEKPGEADLEKLRYDALCKLVPEGKDFEENELWASEGGPSKAHLELIAWAWSPVSERKLQTKK
ncbi:MAG: hypothetical protein Q9227_002849 [Pyrenula ochraceoflavens]